MKLIEVDALMAFLIEAQSGENIPPEVNRQQAELVSDSIDKIALPMRVRRWIEPRLFRQQEPGVGPELLAESLIRNVWVMGFQMGREFETRTMDEALKNVLEGTYGAPTPPAPKGTGKCAATPQDEKQ
jgi:hypothetical protein